MDRSFVQNMGLWIGSAICVLVLFQLCLVVTIAALRTRGERRRQDLEAELLRTQIEAARKKRVADADSGKAWEGWRKFEVHKKNTEAKDTASFYLVPHDKKKLPGFLPGQYLTFQLNIAGQPKPVVRCYSLSDGPRDDYYRVTIKRVPPPRDKPEIPPGLSSSHFHAGIKEGDILDVKAPHGSFYLDMNRAQPVVLIGGGIGVTPVLSMLNAIAASGVKRETWFFLGVRNSSEHAFKEHLETLGKEHDNIRTHVCYSEPGEKDVKDRDYQHAQRVSVDLIKQLLPSSNYHYYLCGPGPFMESITEGLRAWGVPDDHVHFEAFGPASVKKVTHADAPPAAATAERVDICFAKSGKTVSWDGRFPNLLELAEAQGIRIDNGCRAGNCGTCTTAVKSGKIKYPKETGVTPEAGSCLVCIGKPDGPLTLDA